MTWNPRDAGHKTDSMIMRDSSAPFQLPERPAEHNAAAPANPYLPSSTPTVAEAMGWDDREPTPGLPMDLQRALINEGVVPEHEWDTWKSFVLRGHYE